MITDVSVSSPVPGTVLIVPLTEVDETPAQVITDVYDVCSAENVRPPHGHGDCVGART